jgi:thiosulfate reductase cytochrome b subunit
MGLYNKSLAYFGINKNDGSFEKSRISVLEIQLKQKEDALREIRSKVQQYQAKHNLLYFPVMASLCESIRSIIASALR